MKPIKMQLKTTNSPELMRLLIFKLILLFLCSFTASAQITIDQSDMPVPGDTIRKSNALNFYQFDFSETGPGFTWDFSGLLPIIQTVDTFVAVTETPIFYWPFFLLSANIASPQADSPFEQIPLTDLYTFYKNSEDNFRDVGFAATVFGLPLPFNFDLDDVIYDFPMNYGNVDSSQSGVEKEIPGLAYVLLDRYRVNTVDGWGDLITPFGEFEVLRLKSEVQEYDSLYIDSLNIGIPINLSYIEYKWMAKGMKLPVLKATENIFGVVVEYLDSIRDLTVSIPVHQKTHNEKLLIYPNPVKQQVNIGFFMEYDSQIQLSVYSPEGKKQVSLPYFSQRKGNVSISLDIKSLGLNPGKYILNIVTPDKKLSGIFIYFPDHGN